MSPGWRSWAMTPTWRPTKQNYDADTSWKAYFESLAEASLSETAYYCDLAQAAGYEFSQEELSPGAGAAGGKRRLLHRPQSVRQELLHLLYGSGMTEEITPGI